MADTHVKALPPIVMSDTVPLPDGFVAQVRQRIRRFLPDGANPTLEGGPFITAPNHSLHATTGAVEEHADGAGYTYGLVVVADGDHVLCVDDSRFPLRQGDVFRINSDDPHSTTCADPNGVLAFIAMDFFHGDCGWPNRARQLGLTEPEFPLEQYGSGAIAAITAELDRLATPRHPDKGE